jgi:hypothetical protein
MQGFNFPWGLRRRSASGAPPPRRASSDDATRGVRFEWHHGRCEVRAATIVCDILWSGAVRAARVTTSICSCVVDDVLGRLPTLIGVVFRLLCCMPTTCTIYVKTVQFYIWTRNSYINLQHAYFFIHIGKIIPRFILFVITIKIKSNHLCS